jgi:hypothetical protein
MVQRKTVKSCCGKASVTLVLTKPARISHVELFKQNGFQIPDVYVKAGILYAKKNGLIATATFGICTVNVRCSGPNCDSLINELEKVFSIIENE